MNAAQKLTNKVKTYSTTMTSIQSEVKTLEKEEFKLSSALDNLNLELWFAKREEKASIKEAIKETKVALKSIRKQLNRLGRRLNRTDLRLTMNQLKLINMGKTIH